MKGVLNRFNARKNVITSDMAKAVVAHTDKAFAKEGYTKSAYVRWKKKKRYDGFKILHKTNTLSISTYIVNQTWPLVVVRNDTPYADFHNEGDGVTERHFLDKGPGESPALDRKLDMIMDRHINYVLHG
jgi:phage gpG-like protein